MNGYAFPEVEFVIIIKKQNSVGASTALRSEAQGAATSDIDLFVGASVAPHGGIVALTGASKINCPDQRE
jgi:hypothetical protein